MDLNLKDKKVLVWGASQGIGLAIAKSFRAEGSQVTIVSRNKDKLKKVSQENNIPHFISANLSSVEEGISSIEKASDLMGGIDIFVINTGGPEKNSFEDVKQSQWELDFNSLWLSPCEALKKVLPKMKAKGFGRVLLVSSIAAKEPLKDLTTSNGFRAGLTGLFKSMSNEYAEYGITFNILCPGYTNTERIRNLNLKQEVIESLVPAKRLGEPEELANLATFLGSDKAAYITGQQICIDGGANKGF
ncbi:MAG: short-chain dehydrogenase [Halobacteriovoraceae bacterium]|nr:short-chain dehydrogenase [Halobacteriovoraceae bacterium]|tara:strand:- start:189 stop:926 length:738 start_codon:yes stop_codon:yes gene_type:complete